jgi:hypothetical protein
MLPPCESAAAAQEIQRALESNFLLPRRQKGFLLQLLLRTTRNRAKLLLMV